MKDGKYILYDEPEVGIGSRTLTRTVIMSIEDAISFQRARTPHLSSVEALAEFLVVNWGEIIQIKDNTIIHGPTHSTL